jgi:hypothetical protein
LFVGEQQHGGCHQVLVVSCIRLVTSSMTVILIAVFVFLFGGSSESFFPIPRCHRRHHHHAEQQSVIVRSGVNRHDSISSSSGTTWTVVGVSVSPKGFHVILCPTELARSRQHDSNIVDLIPHRYLPIAITPPDKFQDSQTATSVESLTILQLLNGVDLAGPILPPDILGRMLILSCYNGDDDDHQAIPEDGVASAIRNKLLAQVERHLPKNTTYVNAHPWFRSRVPLPLATLDRVTFSQPNETDLTFALQCHLMEDEGNFHLRMTANLLEQVTGDLGLSSTTSMAANFLGIALALRYKAPLVTTCDMNDMVLLTKEQLLESFPLYRTKEKLQVSSDRVSQSIERGFQVFLLTRALELAQRRGDALAAAKIRAKMDDYDRLDELPTIPIQYGNEGQQNEDGSDSSKSWQDLPLQ